MPTRRIAILALVTVTSSAGLLRPASAQGETYRWRFQWKRDDTERFRTYIRINGRSADDVDDLLVTLRSESRHAVKDVSADGTVTYDQSDDTRQSAINGKAIPDNPAARKPIAVSFAANGLMVKRVNPAAEPFDRAEKAIPVLQSIPAPEQPVKIGDTWKAEFPNTLLKNQNVTATSTLLGKETVLGVEALKVKLEMSFPSTFGATESEIIHVQAIYFVDPKAQQLLRADYTVKNPLLPLPGKDFVARVYLSRIMPGQNDKADPDGEKLLLPEKK